MLVKESSDLALQLSCVLQLAHGNGVFKEFSLDIRRQIVPLHDDCGAIGGIGRAVDLDQRSLRGV